MAGIEHEFAKPEALADHHNVKKFDCGRSSLNDWLVRTAMKNEKSGGSRTYVVSSPSADVIAYYSLAAGSVVRFDAPKPISRNMPDPIPVIVLGRFAIDRKFQGRGLGAALLHDAAYRAKAGAAVIGARALLAHALDDRSAAFYEAHGLVRSPVAPLTMMIAFRHL